MIEIVGGLLGGAVPALQASHDETGGMVIAAIDVAAFRPVDEFRQHAERLATLLATAAAPMAVPGEAEAATRATRVRDGIPLDDDLWSVLATLPGGPTRHA
jgi:LDH2 family malate/lactate/ureidoglycolate dehydrogenase